MLTRSECKYVETRKLCLYHPLHGLRYLACSPLQILRISFSTYLKYDYDSVNTFTASNDSFFLCTNDSCDLRTR
jgi:hypothetical protein